MKSKSKKNHAFGRIFPLLCLCICWLSSPMLFAQSATVTGKVVDQNGESLPGAAVQVAGSTRGVTTDEAGVFTMTNVKVGTTLSVSFIGMETKEVVFRGERNLTVVLEEKRSELDEVVVVGYGTQKKGNLTAAISTIKAAEIQTTTATSIAHKLQGKLPGLNIRQSNGEPGLYDEAINIRGFGEPLYVIDGIQRPASVFQRINGADIENISILKDAAAAVYGINAANGVVIVTTKHGGKGKTDFNFSSTAGFSTLYRPSPANAEEAAENYRLLFENPNNALEEVIFPKGFDRIGAGYGSNQDNWGNPAQTAGPWPHPGRFNPTLDLIDVYESYSDPGHSSPIVTTTDGNTNNYNGYSSSLTYLTFDDPQDIFKDKDARMHGTVITPNSMWKNTKIIIQGGFIRLNGAAIIEGPRDETVVVDGITYSLLTDKL